MRKLYLTVAGAATIYLSACTKESISDPNSLTVPSGNDITTVVNLRTDYKVFLLEPGTYTAFGGQMIRRNDIIIRKKEPASEVRIIEPMQICGDNNIIDGLTWDGNANGDLHVSDPGTLAIAGSSNTIRNCIFRNMAMSVHGTEIISIGRLKSGSQFINKAASHNIIENCTFDTWGLRDEPKGSTKSSTCISVGQENEKGKFTGTIIRNNAFLNGPYKQYGYNAAIKVFNSVTLENNLFYGGQECLEIKYGNSTIRGNTLHHFSGYNILANRSGTNNLYENNIVYDVRPVDNRSSAQGFMIWDAGNTVYRNNLIYDCAQTGLILGKETSGSNLLQYVLIENNSFIGNSSGIHFNNQQGSPRHVTLVKNIFYGRRTQPITFMISGFDPASIEYFAANAFYNNVFFQGDSSSLKEDPQFTDTAARNFSLNSGSPACGYGAYPCTLDSMQTLSRAVNSPNIIIYPTRIKDVFHIGLAGLDVIPRQLEIIGINGKPVLRKTFVSTGDQALKLFSNIDLRAQPAGTYIAMIRTASGSFSGPLQVL
jgi:hypothetical protein